MRDERDIIDALENHGASVWRACSMFFRCKADAEDAYQEAFLKYSLAENERFNDEQHKRAWLIKVASNTCKDMLRKRERKNVPISICDSFEPQASDDPFVTPGSFASEVIDAMREMKDPPKTPLYLAICEEYSSTEIADIMNVPVNTVYTWLSRGRKMLKEVLK